jgi:hypothetical protein
VTQRAGSAFQPGWNAASKQTKNANISAKARFVLRKTTANSTKIRPERRILVYAFFIKHAQWILRMPQSRKSGEAWWIPAFTAKGGLIHSFYHFAHPLGKR